MSSRFLRPRLWGNPEKGGVHSARGIGLHPLSAEEAELELPVRPRGQGHPAVGADDPVPGEVLGLGKAVKRPDHLPGPARGKPRRQSDIPVAGNPAPRNRAESLDDADSAFDHAYAIPLSPGVKPAAFTAKAAYKGLPGPPVFARAKPSRANAPSSAFSNQPY
jgi:hypothetical protein